VGLKLQRRFEAGPEREIAFLAAAAGETEVELIADQGKEDIEVGQDISLGFEIESVSEKMKFLQEKGVEL